MIVAHNTGKSLWTPQTPDGAQEGLVLKPSGADGRCFVIVAIMAEKVVCNRMRWIPLYPLAVCLGTQCSGWHRFLSMLLSSHSCNTCVSCACHPTSTAVASW